MKASAEEQDVAQTQKTISEVVLRGVEVKDHWRDPVGSVEYALAVLQMDKVEQTLQSMHKLNATVRGYVRANARRAFRDLDAELRKRSQN